MAIMILVSFSYMRVSATSALYSNWEWSNNRSPLGAVGSALYLEQEVEVVRAVGGVTETHYIKGAATLVKNNVDPYCYVKIAGEWYVHLAGTRTDNGYGTTGWYKESDVITSAGFMVYQNELPIITAQDIHIYANATWEPTRILEGISAMDKEDGDISHKLILVNGESLKELLMDFAKEEVDEMREYELVLEVEDSQGESVRKEVKVYAYGIEALVNDYGYVRYISEEYIQGFSSQSIWRDTQRMEFLENNL